MKNVIASLHQGISEDDRAVITAIAESLETLKLSSAKLSTQFDEVIRRVGVIEERLNAPASQPGMTPFCIEHKEAIEKLSTHVESVETKVNTKIEELQRKVWGWSATLGAMIVVASIAIPLILHFLPKKGP